MSIFIGFLNATQCSLDGRVQNRTSKRRVELPFLEFDSVNWRIISSTFPESVNY